MSEGRRPALLAYLRRLGRGAAVSVTIITLTEGVLHAMFLSKIKGTLAVILALAALGGTGLGTYYLYAQDSAPQTEQPAKKPAKKPVKDVAGQGGGRQGRGTIAEVPQRTT